MLTIPVLTRSVQVTIDGQPQDVSEQFFRCPAGEVILDLFVPGIPAPGGSKRGFYNHKTRRVIIVDDAKRNKPWRESVMWAARAAMRRSPVESPVAVQVTFVMPRPKHHFRGKARSLRGDAPGLHTKKPDATKLWRAAEDALTGIVWLDDAQVAEQEVRKVYGETPGMRIVVVACA
jgi:Holliday junction resolvase RusA-like endonuclease